MFAMVDKQATLLYNSITVNNKEQMMNERIRELRTQAAAWVSKNHQPQDPNAYSQQEIDQRYLMYEEKFTELIVRECCDVLYDNELGGYRVNHVLKEHFGVEE